MKIFAKANDNGSDGRIAFAKIQLAPACPIQRQMVPWVWTMMNTLNAIVTQWFTSLT